MLVESSETESVFSDLICHFNLAKGSEIINKTMLQ